MFMLGMMVMLKLLTFEPVEIVVLVSSPSIVVESVFKIDVEFFDFHSIGSIT